MAVLVWPLAILSVLGSMGDPYPTPTADEIRRHELILSLGLVCSLVFLSLSSWIGGAAFHYAKKRSLAIGLVNAGFLLSVLVFFSLDFFGF